MFKQILSICVLLSVTVFSYSQEFKSIMQEQSEYYKSLGITDYSIFDTSVPIDIKSSLDKSCSLEKIVFGYHPYWVGNAHQNYDWNLISDFCYFEWEFSPVTGNVTNTYNWETSAAVDAAITNGVRLHLCVPLFSNHATFLENPTARANMINDLITSLQARNAIGVNIDFELVPPAQKDNITSFMAQLSNEVRNAIPGAIISVALPAVDWSGVWDIPNLNPHVDWFIIMGYDYYYSSSLTAGPVGPTYSFQTDYDRNLSRSTTYYLNAGVEKEDLILAIPYYGREWSTVEGTVPSETISNISSRFYNYIRNNPDIYSDKKWDVNSLNPYYVYHTGSEWRQCFVDDEISMRRKYDLVNIRDLGGIGIWALGYDDGYTELWDAITDRLTTCAVVPCSDTIWDLGGPGRNYYNNEEFTYTIAPDNSGLLSLDFSHFNLPVSGDTLWIYDGHTIAAPLINAYTGTNSPGLIQSSGPALTVRFKSNNTGTASGWQAIWNCNPDNIPPTTQINTTRHWYGNDFDVQFIDEDNEGGSGVRYSFYQVMDYDGTEWRANSDYGFFNDNFTTAIHQEWTDFAGTWSISNGHLLQTNQDLANTNLYASVEQTEGNVYLYHWQMKISGSGTNRRAGMHFFCSDPEQNNRENSYMVFFRVDSDKVQLYKYVDNAMNLVTDDVTEVNAGQWYDIKIIFDTNTGQIMAFKNDQLVSQWTDTEPYTAGNSISLRTANCEVEYDDIKVYIGRSQNVRITVGDDPSNMVRYESPNAGQDAARIRTVLIDNANNWSESVAEHLYIDWTAPETESTVENEWQTENFVVEFDDADELSGIERRYYQVLDFDGEHWRANPQHGFYCDVMDYLHPEWTQQVGTWEIQGNAMVQTDEASANTNIHAYLQQDLSNRYLYEFNMKIDGSGENRRAGFHYFCDDPTLSNRGNSYFIWFREATKDLEFYKVEDNVFSLKKHYKIDFDAGQWYNIKLIFDRVTGEKFVYMDDVLVGEWKDPEVWSLLQHENHSYISFRSGNCIMSVNHLKVYRTRLPELTVTLGDENAMIRHQNPAPETYGAKIKSIVTDSAQNLSQIFFHDLNIDWTPPLSPAFVNDGYGADIDITYNLDEISANWAIATDPNSGIAKYYYAVGTSPGASDLIDWTDNGLNTSFINTDITLIEDETYYTSVIAENNAGLQSDLISSDGVLAAVLVEPVVPDCPEDFEVCLNDDVFQLSGAEPNGGMYSGNGVSGNINFNPSVAGIGAHTITYDYYGEVCTFEITINELPIVTCPEDMTVLNTDNTIMLEGAEPNGGNYEYNGIIIMEFDPGIGAGEFELTYLYTNPATGCSNNCSFMITVENDPGTDVYQLSKTSGINIYPNPSDGEFVIDLGDYSNSQFSIYDSGGRILNSDIDFMNTKEIKLYLPKGMYFLFVFNKNEVFNEKIIIH